MANGCGKDCASCPEREQGRCRGCLESQGTPYWGRCGVAQCCGGKGLEVCADCGEVQECALSQRAEEEREACNRRLDQERQQEEERRSQLRQVAPLLAKWLRVLFWVGIAGGGLNVLLGLIDQQAVGIQLMMYAVDLGVLAVSLVIYWKLSKVSRRFRTVLRCQLVGVALVAVAVAFGLYVTLSWLPRVNAGELDPFQAVTALMGGSAVLLIGTLVFAIVTLYQFCEAVAEQLDGVDPKSAHAWRRLRTVELWTLGVVTVGTLVSYAATTVGMLLVLLAALVLLVCGVIQMVLLWKAGSRFRAVAEETPLPPAEIA